jgi:hypothetical protein
VSKKVILFVNFIGFKGKAKLSVSRRPKVNVKERKKLLENYRINSAEKRTTIEGFSNTNSEVGITEYVFCNQSFQAEQSRFQADFQVVPLTNANDFVNF